MKGKVLVLCGTGSIGSYTVKELLSLGYKVDVTTREDLVSDNENVRYFKTNSYDDNVLKEFFANNKYDTIIDFSHYTPETYNEKLEFLAQNTDQLIFLSSYRVYADLEHPIKETSPQLIDVTNDSFLLNEENYAMYKCGCEKVINASPYKNKVTIIRPIISFYYKSLSLITTPAPILIPRSLEGKKLLLPIEGKDVYAGYGWSGNTGKLISRLVMNEKAMGEAFTISSGENVTWGEIAEYYKEYLGTEYEWTDKDTYLKTGTLNTRADLFGLDDDRLLDRRIDVSKVLNVTGLTKDDLLSIKDALKYECERLMANKDTVLPYLNKLSSDIINQNLDTYFSKN